MVSSIVAVTCVSATFFLLLLKIFFCAPPPPPPPMFSARTPRLFSIELPRFAIAPIRPLFSRLPPQPNVTYCFEWVAPFCLFNPLTFSPLLPRANQLFFLYFQFFLALLLFLPSSYLRSFLLSEVAWQAARVIIRIHDSPTHSFEATFRLTQFPQKFIQSLIPPSAKKKFLWPPES